jgi:hypothetical protein
MNKFINFSLGIPLYDKSYMVDILIDSINRSILKPKIVIFIVNGKDYISEKVLDFKFDYIIIKNKSNIGVSSSWNKICKISYQEYDCEDVILMNEDVVVDKYLFYNIINSEGKLTFVNVDCSNNNIYFERDSVATEKIYHAGYSCFKINNFLYSTVGEFDENFFPAYYEDSDYEKRIDIHQLNHLKSTISANLKHGDACKELFLIEGRKSINRTFTESFSFYNKLLFDMKYENYQNYNYTSKFDNFLKVVEKSYSIYNRTPSVDILKYKDLNEITVTDDFCELSILLTIKTGKNVKINKNNKINSHFYEKLMTLDLKNIIL